MVAGKSPEELPQGWKEHIKVKDGKKIKSYTDPETGKKFYSKTGALRYINAKNDGNSTPQKRSTRGKEGSESKADSDCNGNPQLQSTRGEEGSESKADSDCNVAPQPQGTCVKEGSESKADLDCNVTPQPRSTRGKEGSESKANAGGAETNETPAWLPHGWIMEVKSRGGSSKSGSTYKVYTDPSTGSKFYSKPEVTRYLEKLDQSNNQTIKNATVDKSLPKIDVSENQKSSKGDSGISEKEKNSSSKPSTEIVCANSTVGKSSSKKDVSEDQKSSKGNSETSKEEKNSSCKPSTEIVCAGVVGSGSVDGLPAGWTTEYKTRSTASGTKRDPYYTDPASGYVFRSKKDVFRYLETGDIRKCAMRPKKRDEYNESEFTKDINANTPVEKSLPKDVSEHLVSTKGQSSTSRKKQNSISKTSTEIVPYDEAATPVVDELPPGWIKEIKTTKYGNSIRRDAYYLDPVSGYMFRSKKDVFRYIESGDISKCASRPKKMDPNDLDTTKDVTCNTPKENSHTKEDVSEHHVLTNGESSKSKRKRNSISKPSVEIVPSTEIVPADLVEVASADGLPLGWIKEIKTTRNAHGIRRDASFTDPVSGYTFRSRKDALRYIETGDITKCILKPTKRGAKGPGSTDDCSFPSTPADKKYTLRSSRGQLSSGEKSNDGKENLDMSSSTPMKAETSTPLKAETSKRKKVDSVGSVPAADAMVTDPVTEVPEKKQPYRRGRKSRKTAQSSEPESNDGPKQDNIVSIDNVAVSNAGTDHLHGKKMPKAKSTPKPKISRKKPTDSKEAKRTPQSFRGRLSKRLAGSQPEMPNLQLSERSLRAAMKSCEEVDILSIINMNSLPNGVSQPEPLHSEPALGTPVTRFVERNIAPVETMKMVAEEIDEIPEPLGTEPAKDVGDIVNMVVESISKFEVSDMNEEPPAEDETVPEQKLGGQVNEKRDYENPKTQNQQGTYQFLDSWSDPCLDFAFKTLTGTFAVNNNPSYLGSSQHQSGSSQHQSGSSQHQSGSSQHQSSSSHHQSGSSLHQTGSSQHQISSSQYQTGSSAHQTVTSSHHTGAPQHQTSSSLHQTGSSQYQISSSQYQTGSSAHQTVTSSHHTGAPQHQTGSSQYQISSSQDQTGSSSPQTDTSLLHTGAPQHHTGAPQHHTGTFQHQTSTFQHQSGTFPHQTSTFQHQTGTSQQQTGTFLQQTGTSYIQRDKYFGQSESHRPGIYLNSMPSHSNSVEQHVQVEQLPRTSTFFPETFSSPLFGGSGSQQHVQEEQWPRNLNSLPSNFSSPTFGGFSSQQHLQVDQMPRNEIPPGFSLPFGGGKPRDQTSIPPGFTLPFGSAKPRDQTSIPPGFNLPFGGGKPRDETSIPPGYSFPFGGASSQQQSSDSRDNYSSDSRNNYQRNNDYK